MTNKLFLILGLVLAIPIFCFSQKYIVNPDGRNDSPDLFLGSVKSLVINKIDCVSKNVLHKNYEVHFDRNGNKLKSIWYGIDNEIHSESFFYYDSSNRLVRDSIYDRITNKRGIRIQKYNTFGKLIESLNYSDGKLESEYFVEYFDDNSIKKESTAYFNDSVYKIDIYYEFSINRDTIIKKEFENKKQVLTEFIVLQKNKKTYYSYPENGEFSFYIRMNNDLGQMIKTIFGDDYQTNESGFSYDQRGNLIQKSYYNRNNDLNRIEKYSYDECGNYLGNTSGSIDVNGKMEYKPYDKFVYINDNQCNWIIRYKYFDFHEDLKNPYTCEQRIIDYWND